MRPGSSRMPVSIAFGTFRFEPATGRLWSGADELRLTPKAAEVLHALVTQAGQLVSKDALFDEVWKDTAVGDDALTSCIQELRRVLGDDPRQPRFIETRHRRGYRFIPQPAASPEPAPAPVESSGSDGRGTTPAPDVQAIAVLPFADMSPGRDQSYLCEGLAEELINALTHVEGLRIVSRTASFQFRASGADVQAVGRQLSVGTLLEGSVRKAGDQLRVTVQLIDVATGYQRWAKRFDRQLADVFAIEDEIAETVAASLRGGVLTGREKQALVRPQTGSTAAYEYYLRARHLLPHTTRPELEQSARFFEEAIELDAGYAPAYAGLATVLATLCEWFGGGDAELDKAERVSRRALELAPALAESHVARGVVLSLARDYPEAGRAFDEAIRINPRLFEAYYYYARAVFAAGDIARAADLFRTAGEVRQEDYQSPMLLAQCLETLKKPDETRAAARQSIARAERALELNPRDGRALSLVSGALYLDGQVERAIEWAERALEYFPDDEGALINGACLHARLGHKEEALALLTRVFARGRGKRDWVEHDKDYDILRDDPRFQAMLERLK